MFNREDVMFDPNVGPTSPGNQHILSERVRMQNQTPGIGGTGLIGLLERFQGKQPWDNEPQGMFGPGGRHHSEWDVLRENPFEVQDEFQGYDWNDIMAGGGHPWLRENYEDFGPSNIPQTLKGFGQVGTGDNPTVHDYGVPPGAY